LTELHVYIRIPTFQQDSFKHYSLLIALFINAVFLYTQGLIFL